MKTPSVAPDEAPAHAACGVDTTAPAKTKVWRVGTLTYTGGGIAILFLWLLFGDFAWSMRDRSVGAMSAWYLNHLGVSNILFGLLMSSFPALLGMVLGPVISVKSDRHRGRLGRRIPFLLVTTPIGALGMIGIAFTPIIAKWVHGHFPGQSELLVSVLCFGVFWAAFELATIAGQAVFGGLINDVVPSHLLGRFYGLFRAVSLIDGIIFNYWIMGKVPEHFTLILMILGVFYGSAFLWVCFKIREGEYPPVSEPEGVSHSALAGVRGYFRECFSRPYYIFVFVMLMMAQISFIPINTFSIPYARNIGMSMEMYGHCLAITYAISLSLSWFLGWMADRFHPIRMGMVTLSCYVCLAFLGLTYATTPDRFAIAFIAHGVLSGCYFTSAASLGLRLFPRSKFAQYASAAGMMVSICTMGLGPIVGTVIDWTGNVYRYTFLIGGILAMVALLAAWQVYIRFMKLGGPEGYVAPE